VVAAHTLRAQPLTLTAVSDIVAAMTAPAVLRGYLLEEALAWLLRNTGYRLLVHESQDPDELVTHGSELRVRGRGTTHQVDVLGEFAFTPAFSLPIRLFLEAKFTRTSCRLPVVRNAHGVIHDINENFVQSGKSRPRRRYQYAYALFSASGFTREAQDFALAHQISLIDVSGAWFAWLRDPITATAQTLADLGDQYQITRFPVTWMRQELRAHLGTVPAMMSDIGIQPTTNAPRFRLAAGPIVAAFAETLAEDQRRELLLGFPAAPLILPLAVADTGRFLAYAATQPAHVVRLRRTGTGTGTEWAITPRDDPEGYRLTFNLPEQIESWISQHEERRASRTRAVKEQLLSDITIYRTVDDQLWTYQLRYEPSELRRQ
jgi:hypothetical protein